MYDKEYFEGKGSNYSCGLVSHRFTAGKREVFESFVSTLKSCGKAGGRLLDAGCGLGYFLAVCDRHGYETFGLDISEYAVGEARKHTKADLRIGDVQKLPFSRGTFDIVTLLDILEHVEHPDVAISECRRVLKPGGVMLILTPNAANFWVFLLDRDKTHIQHFNSKSLISLLDGFTLVSLEERVPFLTFIKWTFLRQLLRCFLHVCRVNINFIALAVKDDYEKI